VLLPGVSFRITPERRVMPLLDHIRAVAAVVTYGGPWWVVRFVVGDLPRWQHHPLFPPHLRAGRARGLPRALRHEPAPPRPSAKRFLAKVEQAMAAFG
jgi:hypothetical protein